MSSERSPIAATIAAYAAAAGLVATLAGPVIAHFDVATPFTGFRVFLLGGLASLAGLVAGLIGVVATRRGGAGRDRAWFGVAVGALLVAAIAAGAAAGRGLPRINDITTNPDDPPGFEAAARQASNQGRDMSYPAGFAAEQRAAYADLAPIALDLPPIDAFERARRAAESLGWEITLSDPKRGLIEAREVSGLFHFVDDIAIRVRDKDGGSLVDIRSKSRVGQGDLGANARRIRVFAAELKAS